MAAAEAEDQDDLDQLLDQYDAQAAQAKQAVQAKQAKPVSQKGMRELRDDGLATRLEASNKGYQLLQKMGYQSGQGLGRGTGGRADPLELSLKPGRTGLGIDEGRKRQRLAAQQAQQHRELKRAKGQDTMRLSFREQQAAHFANKRADKHVQLAREACETLDRRAGLPHSLLWPLEPPAPQAQDAAQPEGQEAEPAPLPPHVQEWEDRPPSDKLALLVSHLRGRHCHCIFCGVQYKDAEELASACPGEHEDDH